MAVAYKDRSAAELQEEYRAVKAQFDALKSRELKLNMSRGKPSKAQLDMVSDIMDVFKTPEDYISDGIDVRNYGELSGLPAAKRLFAEILGCKPEECFIGGNASLTLMYDTISKAFTHGLLHSGSPWCRLDTVKWLCPAPGYDRHFKITQSFGCEMIVIPMTPTGPDMDLVEEHVKDPAVKGMWCVPKYSNPDGIVYSEETIRRIANLKPAAQDFTLMWDNAYCIHEFEGEYVEFPDILSLCREAGNPDMVYEFASTSKVTFPGAGISVMATSEANQKYMQKLLAIQTISYDKVNQQAPRPLPQGQGPYAGADEEARGAHGSEVPVRAAPSRRHCRPWHRQLGAPERRLFRLLQHGAGTRQADAGPLQRSGRHDDRRGRDVPVRDRPAGFQHPHRAVSAAGRRAGAGNGGLHDEPCASPRWNS